MAAKAASLWVCAKTPYSHQGVSDLSSNRSELALNSNFRKWECSCLAVASAQRAITPVEDEKPSLTCAAESSGAMERIQDNGSREFHKDMNLLPKPLTAIDLSPRDGSKVRVAYQGLPGAYSEAAAVKAYPKCETVPCDQFEAAFKAVELWLVDKAVLPIENSVGGSIHRNYDLLLHHRLHIVGEVQLQVNHCLLGLPGARKEELKRVLSHYQAFAQCEMTLSSFGLIRINTDDSALAAQMVASTGLRDTGAVASARAASIYGLDILAEKIQRFFSVLGTRSGTHRVITQLVGSLIKEYPTNGIMTESTRHAEKFLLSMTVRLYANSYCKDASPSQDDDDNITRFLILGREPIIPGTDRQYKTSVVFTLEEGPGVLFKALAVFALRGINLTKIESRPQKQRPLRVVDDSNEGSAKYFDYLFYIDFEASMADPRAQFALEHLKEFARFLRVLGCYPKGTIP